MDDSIKLLTCQMHLTYHGGMDHKTLRSLLDEQQKSVVTREATRLRRWGWTYAKIGLELGYTRQYIYYLLKKKRARI